MQLILGKVYYFNNRPVIPLALEHADIYRCYAKLNLDHDITGHEFCASCVAGAPREYHNHDMYQETIDFLMESIHDAEIMWIPAVYLREQPLEFKANEKLRVDNQRLETRNTELKANNADLEKQSCEMKQQIELASKHHAELIAKHERLNEQLEADIEALEQKLNEIGDVHIQGSHMITATEFNEIYLDHLEFQDLEKGGVDNWTWYSESIRSPEDYQIDLANFYR